MKRLTWTVMVLVIVVAMSACSGQAPVADIDARSSTGQAVEAAPSASDENMQKAREERERAEREQLVKVVKDAFGSESSAWEANLKGSGDSLCEHYEKFYRMHRVLSYMDPRHVQITWAAVGIDEKQARADYRKAGLAYTKSLERTLGLPYEKRENTSCGSGEGGLYLYDGGRVMKELIGTLKAVDANPEGIGTTSAGLRAKLLVSYVDAIKTMREKIKSGEASESDGGGILIGFAEKAIRDWNFTPAQLGLTSEEAERAQHRG